MRVRSNFEKEQTRKRMRELARERSKNATDKGKNSERVGNLDSVVLDFLWGKYPRIIDVGFLGKYLCQEMPDAPHIKGYPRVNLQGSDFEIPFNRAKMLYLSHVSLSRSGIFPNSTNDDASHLCGNTRCVKPEHLVWEPHSINVSRTNCVGDIACDCGIHSFCNHDPKCIKLKCKK